MWSFKSSGKPLWQLGDSTGDIRELGQYLFLFFVMYLFHFILLYLNNCFVIYYFALWIKVFAHTHVHLHNISSTPELRPFRRKCWLRSRQIVISAMASQTLPEFMVLMTSWGCNLRTVIRKCSHLNRTLSIWAYNGWGSGCLASPLGMTVRNDSGTF